MKRKYAIFFVLLLSPLLILGAMSIAMPTFRTEFAHNIRSMLGFPEPKYGDGEKGLRSERPEEYGGGYASPEEESEEGSETADGDTDEAVDTDDAESDAADAVVDTAE